MHIDAGRKSAIYHLPELAYSKGEDARKSGSPSNASTEDFGESFHSVGSLSSMKDARYMICQIVFILDKTPGERFCSCTSTVSVVEFLIGVGQASGFFDAKVTRSWISGVGAVAREIFCILSSQEVRYTN